jgi:hypothetical protein
MTDQLGFLMLWATRKKKNSHIYFSKKVVAKPVQVSDPTFLHIHGARAASS